MRLPQELWRDAYQALRMFRRQPRFTILVVILLAVGIGATTAVFDLANLLAWRKLPVHEPGELARVFTSRQRGFVGLYHQSSYRDYLDYRDRSRSFSGLAAHTDYELRLEAGAAIETAWVTAVSGNFFEVMGLSPSAGRALGHDDDQPDSAPAAVLSHRLWQRLGGDPEVLGRIVKLGELQFTVVGVAPPRFTSTMAGSLSELFLPITTLPRALGTDESHFLDERSNRQVFITGRLREDVSGSSAEAELQRLAADIDRQHPLPDDAKRRITLTAANFTHPIDLVRMAPTLRIFALAVALLLVITCANVAHLLLARVATRRRELGIRLSLGAKGSRLLQQSLIENLLLALAGGLSGLLLAWGSRAFFSRFAGPDFAQEMRFDLHVLTATFAACLLATLPCGLLPALAAARVDVVQALKPGAKGAGNTRVFAGRLLCVAQIALSVILLNAGTLLTESLWRQLGEKRGFDDRDLSIVRITLPAKTYDPEAGHNFFLQLQQRVQAMPVVSQAGLAMVVPPVLFDISVPLSLAEAPESQRRSRVNIVDSGYFQTLGISLEQGRLFDSGDTVGSQPVAIVNRRLAEQLWPGRDALGRTLIAAATQPADAGSEYVVVGVVSSIRQHARASEVEGVVYFSHGQRYRRNLQLVVSSGAGSATVTDLVRSTLQSMDPEVLMDTPRTSAENRKMAFAFERMQSQAVSVFAVLGFLLSLLGIFGLLSYAVSRRVREMGIRMAIGAHRHDLLRLVLGQGFRLGLIGVVTGFAVAVLSAPLLQSLLHGVGQSDPVVLISVGATVLLAALGAAYLPARRAARLDPLEALRHE